MQLSKCKGVAGMILLFLIFIAIILLFGAAAVKAGLGKGFFVLSAILAVGGIIVSLSGEVGREEALPIFIGVTLTFLLIIALVCFIGFKILTRGTQSGEIPSKSHKQKTILIHILLWCATAISLFFSINFLQSTIIMDIIVWSMV